MRKGLTAGLTVCVALATSIAWAEVKDPLELVPANAGGFLRINNLDAGLAGMTKMLAVADAGVADVAAPMVRQQVSEMLGGVNMAGLDTAGVHMVVGFIPPGAKQAAAGLMMMGMGGRGPGMGAGPKGPAEGMPTAIIVQCSDFAKFRTALLGPDAKLQTEGPWQVLATAKEEIDFEATEKAKAANPNGKVKYVYKKVLQKTFIQQKGSFAIYTTSDSARQLFDASQGALKVSPADAKLLAESDVALYINASHVVATFRDVLTGVQQMVGMLTMMAANPQAAGQADNAQAKKAAAIGRLLPRIINPIFQFIYDLKGLTVAMKFEDDGVLGTTRIAMNDAPGTTASSFQNHKPGAIGSMASLPTGKSVYYGCDMRMRLLIEWYQMLLKDGVADLAGWDAKTQQTMDQMLGQFAKADIREVSGSMGAGQIASIMKVEQPALLREAMAGADGWAAAYAKMMPGMQIDLKKNAETYKGVSIDIMKMKLDLDAMLKAKGGDMPPEAAEMAASVVRPFMTMIYGGENVTMRMAVVGKWFVGVTGEDAAGMHATIDAVKAGKAVLGANASYKAVRAKLPAKTNLVVLVNLPRATQGLMKALGQTPLGAALPVSAREGVQLDDSLSGFSMTLGADSIQFDLYVPHTQIHGMRKALTPATVQFGDQ